MVERRIKVATTSLAGCFGCHMSLLDMDERLLGLIETCDFDRSPLTDIKECSPDVDVGLIEGGLCNAENVHTLREFRSRCRILVAVGACAITGGVPALRNGISLKECLEEAYVRGVGVDDPQIPNDPELPLLLNKVHPINEVVKVDYYLPGCPPPAEAFVELIAALLAGREPALNYAMRHFD
jgi:NAD-reducing hydrogenase small subunit